MGLFDNVNLGDSMMPLRLCEGDDVEIQDGDVIMRGVITADENGFLIVVVTREEMSE